MKSHDLRHDLEVRAAAALEAVLSEVSTIKVREIRHDSSRKGHGLMAYIEILGNRHSLACTVHDGHPNELRLAFEEWRTSPAFRASDALPVIIAPRLSPEAQALCREHQAGYVDLEGNARLALGEVFIVKRTLPHASQTPANQIRSSKSRPAPRPQLRPESRPVPKLSPLWPQTTTRHRGRAARMAAQPQVASF
jgi:hypothetical protein